MTATNRARPAAHRVFHAINTRDLRAIDEAVTEDRIVFRALGRGRGVAEVHGPAAAGKAYAMETVHIYRTEGDRLAEHWGIRDELSALVQLGVVPSPSMPALPVPDDVPA